MKKNNYFKRIYSLIVLGTVGYSVSFAQTFPIVFEAENTATNHYMNIIDNGNYSGGKRLEGQDAWSSYVQYNINGIEEAGTYDVTVIYGTGDTRHFYSKVNSQLPVVVETPNFEGSDWAWPTGSITYQVYFDAGDNVLEIGAYTKNNPHLNNIDEFSIDKSATKIKRPADGFTYSHEVEDHEVDGINRFNIIERVAFASGYGSGSDGEPGNDAWVKYNISGIPEAGEYDILVYYATMDDNRSFYVKSNDGDRIVLYPKERTSSWGDNAGDRSYRMRTQINLVAGNNVIELGHSTTNTGACPNLDKFEIIKIGVNEEDLDPTGIQSQNTDNLNIYASSNKIFINNTNADYAIFNVLGSQIISGQCAGSAAINMPAGIYIVKVNNTAVKVLVK